MELVKNRCIHAIEMHRDSAELKVFLGRVTRSWWDGGRQILESAPATAIAVEQQLRFHRSPSSRFIERNHPRIGGGIPHFQ